MRTDVSMKAFVILLAFAISQPTTFFYAASPAPSGTVGNPYSIPASAEPSLSSAQVAALLQQKIKYVFVIYQENRSFDSYFGTFPGAEGLFTSSAANTPGFFQNFQNIDGSTATIHPFRIGPKESPCGLATILNCYAADTDDIDHSHTRIVNKMDVVAGVPQMDKFALVEEQKYLPASAKTPYQAKQMGELAMAYEDCDTIPLLWQYASNFVLFDHVFQLMTGPSTPGNIAIIGAQSGLTQWALHPNEYPSGGNTLNSGPGVPLLNDANPWWGSGKGAPGCTSVPGLPPCSPAPTDPSDAGSTPEFNMTFATLPLTLAGSNLTNMVKSDQNPAADLADVQADVAYIPKVQQNPLAFAWYEEGYDQEDADCPPDDTCPTTTPAGGSHYDYITHHNGPQYFGYIANNPVMSSQLHGLGDFFTAVENQTLPSQGGVFFVKGGYQNQFGLHPANPNPTVQLNFNGDDDHPAYSDAQISEALVAEAVNKIAESPYWAQSAIIITWDDSEGDYDHVRPPLLVLGKDGTPISDGPRVPFILISPYARTNYIARGVGDHGSVVKFIDTVFNLPPLALLPNELFARTVGAIKIGQPGLGPDDALTAGVSDLTEAFDPARLSGAAAPLPASYAEIDPKWINALPQTTGYGCSNLGITTTDRAQGIVNQIPDDFNPTPKTVPTPPGGAPPQ